MIDRTQWVLDSGHAVQRYERRTYGCARMWDEHGNEIPPTDPRYIAFKEQLDRVMAWSMRPTGAIATLPAPRS